MKRSFKSKIAALLTVALVLTMMPITVLAADEEDVGTTSTVSGTGTTEYVSVNKYRMVLPTSSALKFTLDPQGLLSISDGDQVSLDSISENAGKVVAKDGSTALVVNRSSFPVKVNVSMNGLGDAEFLSSTNMEAKLATVSTNLLLAVVPSSAKTLSDNQYVAAAKGIVVSGTVVSANFLLAKADYTVSNNDGTYTYNYQSGNDDGAGFRVGGYVNTKGDWYDYASGTKSVSLNAVFSFSKADDADEADADAFGYGMMTYSGDTVSVNTADDDEPEPEPEPEPEDLYPTSIEVTRNTNAVFAFENAITVTSVTWKWVDASNVQKGTGTCSASDKTLSGDGKTLTINSAGSTNLTGVPVGNKVTLTVNTSGSPLTLTFTIK